MKAQRTARWATIMTKWLITKMAARPKWQLVSFLGPAGSESRGIVDLMAIRKDHSTHGAVLNRGDLFELILIQVKGGNAAWPSSNDVRRLRQVAKHHRADGIVLAAWTQGRQPALYRLPSKGNNWAAVTPEELFA